MTFEPVRWGIVSTADINRLVIPPAQASPDVDLIAVASRDANRAADYAATWGIPRSYGSYDELLADADVEAVYISLPNTMHCEWSIRAVQAGKHVLCEKPMSRHVAEVEAAFDAAEQAGRHLAEAFMWRHNPLAKRIAELVSGGAIGELRLIRSCFSYTNLDPENIRLRTDVDGGALLDVGCYCISGSRLLVGEPELVLGQQFVGPSGTDWVFTGQMRFPGDVLALFDCATTLPDRDELEAIGTEGSIFVDDPWHARNPVIEVRRDGGVGRIELERVDSYGLELEDLGRAIRGQGAPLLGRDDAVAQARVIDALFRSAESGSAVAL